MKRIMRIPIITSFLWKCTRHTPGKISGLIKTFYWFQQETSMENTCYIKSLICFFWLHVIPLCWSWHFRCNCSFYEEERSTLILSYKTEKERLTVVTVFCTRKLVGKKNSPRNPLATTLMPNSSTKLRFGIRKIFKKNSQASTLWGRRKLVYLLSK